MNRSCALRDARAVPHVPNTRGEMQVKKARELFNVANALAIPQRLALLELPAFFSDFFNNSSHVNHSN